MNTKNNLIATEDEIIYLHKFEDEYITDHFLLSAIRNDKIPYYEADESNGKLLLIKQKSSNINNEYFSGKRKLFFSDKPGYLIDIDWRFKCQVQNRY